MNLELAASELGLLVVTLLKAWPPAGRKDSLLSEAGIKKMMS